MKFPKADLLKDRRVIGLITCRPVFLRKVRETIAFSDYESDLYVQLARASVDQPEHLSALSFAIAVALRDSLDVSTKKHQGYSFVQKMLKLNKELKPEDFQDDGLVRRIRQDYKFQVLKNLDDMIEHMEKHNAENLGTPF